MGIEKETTMEREHQILGGLCCGRYNIHWNAAVLRLSVGLLSSTSPLQHLLTLSPTLNMRRTQIVKLLEKENQRDNLAV
jgi:hypothetical protein